MSIRDRPNTLQECIARIFILGEHESRSAFIASSAAGGADGIKCSSGEVPRGLEIRSTVRGDRLGEILRETR